MSCIGRFIACMMGNVLAMAAPNLVRRKGLGLRRRAGGSCGGKVVGH